MKKRINQSGFGYIGALILLLVLVLAGISGYFVYTRNNKKDSSGSTNQSSISEDKIASTKKEELKEYCSITEKACFKYPSDWVINDNSDADWKEYVGLNWAERLVLKSPEDKVVVNWSNPVGPLGGACMLDEEPGNELSILSYTKHANVQDLYTVSYSDRASLESGQVDSYELGKKATYRVVDAKDLNLKTGYSGTCLNTFYAFIKGLNSMSVSGSRLPILFSAKVNDASDEAAALKVLNSLKYQ